MKKTSIVFLLLSLISLGLWAEDKPKPVANEGAMVVSGNARFTVLTPEMIRIQYSRNAQFEDRASFAIVNRNLPVPAFTTEERDGYLYITTEALTLRYKIGRTLRRNYVNTDDLRITFSMNGKEILWYEGKDDAMNLMGTGRTMDGNIGDTQRQDLEKGLLSRGGWAIIDESPLAERGDGSRSFVFDGEVDGVEWFAQPVDQNAIDWYFFGYGHDYKKALGDYAKVAGRQPLPPMYMFGYWYSKYQRYSAADYNTLAKEMKDNKVPHDVIMFDMDWHLPGWTGWTWDTSLIPNPKTLINTMHRNDLRVALNLHPADGIGTQDEGYQAMASELGTGGGQIPWNLESGDFYKSLFKNIIRKREAEGVDFWWLDWQQDKTSKYVEGLGHTFWLNHVFYNDMKVNRTDRRPVIFHRWGGLGSHRYPLGFSGDTFATYGTLDFESYWTATAANVGFGYWGHDGGGYLQPGDQTPTDPELVLRWMQFAVFQPIFRTHGSSQGVSERRVWKLANFDLINEAFNLRYRLTPYIYTHAREAYDSGVSICRPLYYEWPEENKAYSIENEYMFGNSILVAPVSQPSVGGVSERTVWLPEGRWFDASRGRVVNGNTEFTDYYSLTEIPYFVKAGSIIPCYPVVQSLKTRPAELIFEIYPGDDSEAEVYEDDGDSEAYKENGFARMKVSQMTGDGKTDVVLSPWQGSYEGMPEMRDYKLQFFGAEEPSAVTLDGETLSTWVYDSQLHIVTVTLPQTDGKKAMIVTVFYDAAGINQPAANTLSLAYDEPSAALTFSSDEQKQDIKLRIVTMTGATVMEQSAANSSKVVFDLGGLAAGAYICQVNADGEVVTRKILKME